MNELPRYSNLLTTIRSRRVGRGYRIDSGSSIQHPATGHTLTQAEGPLKFVSSKDPKRLTRLEEALIAWAACGPNGLVAWDISMDGGFHELTWIAGRTCPSPGNSLGTDLLVINDSGAYIYKPTRARSAPIGKCCNFENGDGGRPERDWAVRSQADRSNSLSMN